MPASFAQPLRLPTDADVAERRRAGFRAEIPKILEAGELDPFIQLVQDISASHDIAEVAAAAFKMAAHREQPRVLASEPAPSASAPGRAPRAGRATTDEATARLFLRVGKRHGVRPADVVGAIANEAGLRGNEIGDIDLYDTFSFVEVPASSAAV
jgi:ATP-dependent RNA helicase DeaD